MRSFPVGLAIGLALAGCGGGTATPGADGGGLAPADLSVAAPPDFQLPGPPPDGLWVGPGMIVAGALDDSSVYFLVVAAGQSRLARIAKTGGMSTTLMTAPQLTASGTLLLDQGSLFGFSEQGIFVVDPAGVAPSRTITLDAQLGGAHGLVAAGGLLYSYIDNMGVLSIDEKTGATQHITGGPLPMVGQGQLAISDAPLWVAPPSIYFGTFGDVIAASLDGSSKLMDLAFPSQVNGPRPPWSVQRVGATLVWCEEEATPPNVEDGTLRAIDLPPTGKGARTLFPLGVACRSHVVGDGTNVYFVDNSARVLGLAPDGSLTVVAQGPALGDRQLLLGVDASHVFVAERDVNGYGALLRAVAR